MTSPVTSPLAMGLGGSSLTPQWCHHLQAPGCLAIGQPLVCPFGGRFGCHSPFPRLQPPRGGSCWAQRGSTAAGGGAGQHLGTGEHTRPAAWPGPAVLADQQRVADGQSCPTAARAGDAQKAPLVPPCFSWAMAHHLLQPPLCLCRDVQPPRSRPGVPAVVSVTP